MNDTHIKEHEDWDKIGYHEAHKKYKNIDIFCELVRLYKENKLLKEYTGSKNHPLELKTPMI